MFRNTAVGNRLVRLTKAFDRDGCEVVKVVTYKGRTGITAESITAVNYDTKEPKKVYYLEGNPYETGYLMGSMAEKEISRMMDYTDRVVFSFIGSKTLEKIKLAQDILVKVVYELSKSVYKQLPWEIREEIRGILDGCKNANPKTRVDMEHLVVLNTGIDIICSMVYTGNFFKRAIPELEPEDFNVPMMCNAFTVGGKSAGGGFYFGRDFTFPSSDVFQDTAAPIIYNPIVSPADHTGVNTQTEAVLTDTGVSTGDGAGGAYGSGISASNVIGNRKPIPFVNIAAPGMVGSVAAMNLEGVAVGVNMSPGFNCDPKNIGINSLLMTRMCVQYCSSAESAARLVAELPKGVSWLYVIADGRNSRSCIAEAGASGPLPDLVRIPAEEYRPFLPGMDFIREHSTVPYQNGAMFRWNDYKYPLEYLAFNHQLLRRYNERNNTSKIIHTGAFDEKGYINNKYEQNCPSTFYFAPQREESDDILVASNHYIIPEMRYFAMHSWTERIIGKRADDIQWRYDELNRLIQDELDARGSIGFEEAKRLISFLGPYGRNKEYHADNPRSRDGKEIRIEGCISLFDLKNLAVESHYGYYCDKWVRLSLPNYFAGHSN
ncbi:MAG: carcinine hydrolase/isopenicillin-N N-acyltransferase family protein [Bacillota bacterium]